MQFCPTMSFHDLIQRSKFDLLQDFLISPSCNHTFQICFASATLCIGGVWQTLNMFRFNAKFFKKENNQVLAKVWEIDSVFVILAICSYIVVVYIHRKL